MKTIVRNFTSMFRKFVTASLLNLLGLSLAFASFFVIMDLRSNCGMPQGGMISIIFEEDTSISS